MFKCTVHSAIAAISPAHTWWVLSVPNPTPSASWVFSCLNSGYLSSACTKLKTQADQPDILHIPDINAIKNKEFLYHPTTGKVLKTRDNLSVGFTSGKTGVGTAPAEDDLTRNLV